jgi:hypothetical protein
LAWDVLSDRPVERTIGVANTAADPAKVLLTAGYARALCTSEREASQVLLC